MTLDLEQIKEIIPHRDPFLLIDEVTELEPGVSVTAKKYLKPDEYWFKGHFPNQPITPGVLMIEMLAQAAGERSACLEARHHLPWYLHGVPYAGYYRNELVHVDTLDDIYRIVKEIKRDLK